MKKRSDKLPEFKESKPINMDRFMKLAEEVREIFEEEEARFEKEEKKNQSPYTRQFI